MQAGLLISRASLFLVYPCSNSPTLVSISSCDYSVLGLYPQPLKHLSAWAMLSSLLEIWAIFTIPNIRVQQFKITIVSLLLPHLNPLIAFCLLV